MSHHLLTYSLIHQLTPRRLSLTCPKSLVSVTFRRMLAFGSTWEACPMMKLPFCLPTVLPTGILVALVVMVAGCSSEQKPASAGSEETKTAAADSKDSG